MITAMADWNGARFDPAGGEGHYESWFMRANDAAGERAFWIRYTIFAPRGRAADAVGELWAIVFQRGGAPIAVKETAPLAKCSFAKHRLDVTIGDARLDGSSLRGRASANGHTIAWDLRYAGGGEPILLLPKRLYDTRLPRAKALVN